MLRRVAACGIAAALFACCTTASLALDELESQDIVQSRLVDAAPLQLSFETTAPPAQVQDVPSVVHTLLSSLKLQLESVKFQWCNALVACVLGTILLVDGDLVFRWVVLAVVFILAMLIALNEVTATWGLGYDSPLRRFVSLEAGACCAYAAYKGFDGVMLVVGGLFGLFLAHQSAATFATLGLHALESNRWLLVIWYSLFILGLMAVLQRRKYVGILAMIAPMLGGLLVTSAVSWALTLAAQHGWMGGLHNLLPNLQEPAAGPWVQFLLMLLSSDAPDVGIFANSPYSVTFVKKVIPADRVMGCTFWFILFVLGASIQVKRLKESIKKNKKVKLDPMMKNGLQAPMLGGGAGP